MPSPERPLPFPLSFLLVAVRVVFLLVQLVLVVPLLPVYFLSAARVGWPPNTTRWRQARRYWRLAWTAPSLRWIVRVSLSVSIAKSILLSPIRGMAWLLDEWIYGEKLDAITVREPIFEISAGRSGSTQVARYLEEDPRLVAPNLLQAMFPYLWLWRLSPRTIGRFLTPDRVRRLLSRLMPDALVERHEMDPFRTDTFDGVLYTAHLNHLAPHLGPVVMAREFGFGTVNDDTRLLWEECFVALVDRIARKTLFMHEMTSPGSEARFFVKGHFLCAAQFLAEAYPDGKFLTLIREPAPRLKSAINYLRVNPSDPVLGPVSWNWLAEGLLVTETNYCRAEQAWFSETAGPVKCVVPFVDYVADLEGTMAKIYRDFFDETELPAHVPRAHAPRNRTQYSVDRSLEELWIDEEALNESLAEYREWCRSRR